MKKQIALITILCLTQGVFSMETEDKDAQLYAAAQRGDYEEVSNLLEMGTDANAKTGNYVESALAAAATHGHTEIIELLLKAGADVDARDSDGGTPLMDAAHRGYWHSAKLLIAAGADLNAYDYDRESTPLVNAVRQGHTDIARLLLDAGASRRVRVAYGEPVLTSAAQEGHVESVELLLTHIPLDEHEYIKNTFHALFAMKKTALADLPKDMRNRIRDEITALLTERYMNHAIELINKVDYDGLSARNYALVNNHQAVADLLDLNNPISRERIRKQIEKNIKRILFGEPKERPGFTRELTLEEAFGSWLREPETQE